MAVPDPVRRIFQNVARQYREQNIQETENPELIFSRLVETYQRQGGIQALIARKVSPILEKINTLWQRKN